MKKKFPDCGEFPHPDFGRSGPLPSPKAFVPPKKQASLKEPIKAPKAADLDVKPKPIRGGSDDSDRVRLVKNYYSQVIDQGAISFVDWTSETNYNPITSTEIVIDRWSVSEARFLYIDNVVFYAKSLVTGQQIPPGQIEGFVETYLKISERVPLDIQVRRYQISPLTGAYWPFLNDRVGPTETKFNLIARTGEEVKASYITPGIPSPVPISVIGVRIRGWLGSDIIIKEILEQQT